MSRDRRDMVRVSLYEHPVLGKPFRGSGVVSLQGEYRRIISRFWDTGSSLFLPPLERKKGRKNIPLTQGMERRMKKRKQTLCEARSEARNGILNFRDVVVKAWDSDMKSLKKIIVALLDKLTAWLNVRNKKPNPLCGDCEELYDDTKDMFFLAQHNPLTVSRIPACKLHGPLSWDCNKKPERHAECQKG